MSWKEVLKPSLSDYGPVDSHQVSRLSVSSDGQESLVHTAVDAYEDNGEKLCCGLELACLPGPSGSGSTFELGCVDEWLKTRTESLSSMDMDVAMKSDGIDTNFLSDAGVGKENPNLSELDHFLTPKGGVDLCIVNDVCNVGRSNSRKGLSDLGESEDSGLLLSEDLMLKESNAGKKSLFMVESMDDGGGKDMKDDDSLGRRGSWADSLELGKDKVNWESMSNTSRRSHELEKEVDFPEFNLPTFDLGCPMECSLPVEKDLEDSNVMEKEDDADETVIPESDIKSEICDSLEPNPSPVDPLLASLPETNDTMDSCLVLAKPISENVSLLKNQQPSSVAVRQNLPIGNNNHVAVIAISTNKVHNTTQIVIRTSHGDQQVFKGKTSDLVQATSGINNKSVDGPSSNSGPPKLRILSAAESSKLAAKQPEREQNADSAGESGSEDTSEDQLAMDLGNSEDKADSSGEGNDEDGDADEQPLVDALADLGIIVDSLICVSTLSGQKMWICPTKECGKTYPRLSMLKVHILGHYGVRPYKCDFEGCYWSFYTYFKLKRHKATHLKKKDFECTVEGCGRRFTTVYNLNTHSKLHERPAEMVCHVAGCGASFQTKRKLENHLKEHDVIHAPYRCPYCGKAYYSSNSLNAHVRSHEHKEEEVRCQWAGCGKLFDKPCRLRAHMRSHTGDRPYSCTFEGCSWSFSSASKLRRHQQKHTDERNFKCTVEGCTKAFLRPEHLKEHLSTHVGARNFQCPVESCGVRFSAKSSLYVHMKKHQAPRPEKVMYICPIAQCDRKYLCRSSLRQHILKFHAFLEADTEAPTLSLVTLGPGTEDVFADSNVLINASVPSLSEQTVSLSTIDASDIMLSGLGTSSSSILTNGVLTTENGNHLLVQPLDINNLDNHTLSRLNLPLSQTLEQLDPEEEEGTGCARTNLPFPLVPRRSVLQTSELDAPPPPLLSDDLFPDPMLVPPHPSGIEFQILQLDSRQRDFPESTINLRDLE